MYSKKLTIAGQVDCVAEYNGKLSVIDFKTANKERQEDWIDNYFMQTTAYAHMYEETFGTPIEQIVILLGNEDGTAQCFIKEKKDYEQNLIEAIDGFYKYYEELNKEQVSILRGLADRIKPLLSVKPAEDGTNFTQFSGKFENEEFAKYFTEALLQYTLQFYVEGKTKEIKNNINQIEQRKDSLLKLLINKSKRIANQSVQSIDLNPAYSESMVEGQLLSNEGEFIGKLYSESIASLEIVRSELRQQTPLFTIIEGVEYPLIKEIQPAMRWFCALFVLGFLIGVIYFGVWK